MPGKFPKKTLLSLAFVAVIVLALFLGTRRDDRPTVVSTIHAVRQDLTSAISSNGKVEPVEPHVIQAQLTTFIESVAVKQGQVVRRGQTLFMLNAKDLESELTRARGDLFAAEDERKIASGGGSPDELAQLQNDLAKTETEIARLRREAESLNRLYAKQAATRQEIEQNKIALDKAEADKRLLEQKKKSILDRAGIQAERASIRADEARSSIRSVQEKLNSGRVTAPADGTIFSLQARAGTFVHTGDVLAEMADLTRVQVRAFVDEPEIGLLQRGQVVEITWDGLPSRTWIGKVDQLPKTIVARGSRNVGEVVCSTPNKDSALLPNTNVDVRIRTAERENVLTLPRSVVRSDADKHYVLIVDQGHLRRRDITVGISTSTHFEVLSGISESDLIAVAGSGTSELQDGMLVTLS